jgi:hypothetical protein
MDRNLPATRADTAPAVGDDRPPLPRRQPMSVAFLPLALVAFVIVAFVMAAWTFLAAGT